MTSVFDACGAYNGEDSDSSDRAIVPNQRAEFAKEKWANALDFLEWFGVQKMDNFGLIIINKEDKS